MRPIPSSLGGAARIALLAGVCAVVATGLAPAQRVVVGNYVEFQAATPHPYPTGTGKEPAWSLTVEHPDATYVAVHFDRFELAPGDRVVVRSKTGRQRYTFTGRGKGDLGAFWATHIKGDHAILELFSPRPHGGAWGLSIDKYAAGFRDLGTEDLAATEAICGTDDKQNAVCFQGSEPEIYDKSRAVARLLSNGFAFCTGWLVGCEGHLFTNQYCIGTPADAVNTDYEFLSEADTCGPVCSNCPGEIWPGAASLVQVDAPRDYAFIKLEGNPQDVYGSFLLDDRVPALDERIYIAGHPGGRAKELSVVSTDARDQSGFCEIWSVDEPACQIGGPPDIGYFCDTESGSSGSPVVSYDTHRVIALHHCANCPNRGVPVTAVIDHLGPLLPACAIMPGPALRYDSHVADDAAGNGDGVTDPGETLSLEVDLLNGGNESATGVGAQLSTSHPMVTVTDDTADWPDIGPGAAATSLAPHYAVDVGEGVVCGDVIDFDLDITANEGTWTSSFSEQVGVNVASAVSFPSTDTPLLIPDNDPNGIVSSLSVPAGTIIGDVNVAVNIRHTWIGDLAMRLTSPSGTAVVLHNRSGSSTDDIMTTYDSLTPADGPGSMSDLDGEDAGGTWTLAVADFARQDVGGLISWALIIDAPPDWRCDGTTGLFLTGPTPGLAGASNTLEASGATPGANVTFIFGLAAGSFAVPGCPGVVVDVAAPQIVGGGVAGASGVASVSRNVPAGASGVTAIFQAVELSTCTVSNSVVHTFP